MYSNVGLVLSTCAHRKIGLPDASCQKAHKVEMSEAIKDNYLKTLKFKIVGKVKLEELANAVTRRAMEYVDW